MELRCDQGSRLDSKYLKINSKDTTITTLQPSYSYGMSILNTHVDNASGIVLTNFTIVQKKFWDIYKSNRITNFNGVPITYEIIEKLGFKILNSCPFISMILPISGILSI